MLLLIDNTNDQRGNRLSRFLSPSLSSSTLLSSPPNNLDPLGDDLVIDSQGPDANFGAIPVIEDEDENVPAPGPFTP